MEAARSVASARLPLRVRSDGRVDTPQDAGRGASGPCHPPQQSRLAAAGHRPPRRGRAALPRGGGDSGADAWGGVLDHESRTGQSRCASARAGGFAGGGNGVAGGRAAEGSHDTGQGCRGAGGGGAGARAVGAGRGAGAGGGWRAADRLGRQHRDPGGSRGGGAQLARPDPARGMAGHRRADRVAGHSAPLPRAASRGRRRDGGRRAGRQ